MKMVSNLRINLARIVPMRSAKSETVVQQQPTIGHIRATHGERESLAKILAQCQVKGRMAWQMRGRRVAVGKSRAVVDIGRSITMPRQIHEPANMQSVELIVVERAETIAEGKVGQAAVDIAEPKSHLVRIGHVDLAAIPNVG